MKTIKKFSRVLALILALLLGFSNAGMTASASAKPAPVVETGSTSKSVQPTNYFTASVKGSTGWAGTSVKVYKSGSTSGTVV